MNDANFYATNPSDPTDTVPKVSLNTPRVPGVLPKNLRAWVGLGVATLMMLTILFSSSTAKQKNVPPVPTQYAPVSTSQQIDEYKRQLEAETRKLMNDQKRLAQAKKDAEGAERASLQPPNTPLMASQASGYAQGGGSAVVSAPSISPIEAERQLTVINKARREEKSLYASNIAFSRRSEGTSETQQEAVKASPVILETAALPDVRSANTAPPKATAQKRVQVEDSALQEADGKLYRLFEGTLLETVLTNRLDGSFAGPVNVIVTTNVYSHDRQELLIPQGTRVLGEVEKVSSTGQQRLAVFFHRLIMPDGYVHSLDKFQALGQTGETGLRDQVNHHYVQIFGASLAIGGIAGISQAGANYGASTGGIDAYQRGSSQSLSQSALHILERFLNVLPTFTVREGHRIKIVLTDDLLLPSYANHKVPSNL